MKELNGLKAEEISVFHIAVDLIKNLWVIVMVALSVWIGMGSAADMLYVPEYTAAATVAVGTKGRNTNSLNSLNTTKQLAGAFGEVFRSNVLMDKVREDLKGEKIDGTISAEAISETNLMVLKAVSGNPRTSYLMLQSAFENYESVSEYLFSNAALRIVKEPSVPFSPSNSSLLKENRTLAAAGAAALTAGAIVLLSVFRFTVKTEASARSNLDGSILGLIPFERKASSLKKLKRSNKKALLISSATVSMPFTESYRKLAARLEHHMRKRDQKILLITSVSENEGKSSAAANLSLALSAKGRKVLLVDLDLKKPVQNKIFENGFEMENSLEDYLVEKKTGKEVLNYSKNLKLYTIFQNKGISDSSKWANSERLRKLPQEYRDEMDYIILDTSPMAVSADAEYLMAAADTVALVVRQDWMDVGSINEAVDNIRQSKTDFAGFVLNAFVRKRMFLGGYGEYGYYRYRQRRESDAE